MSTYKTVNYFTHWRFPSATERMAEVTTPSDIGKLAWQKDNNSFWVRVEGSWINLNAAASNDGYTPTKSFDGEVIPANKQRIVYGAYEVVGGLELIGDLVIL